MSILMVKKILLNGSPCGKCVQAEEILRKRGFWERIDSVVYAEEGNPDSDGMKLAKEFDIKLAPFFIVGDDDEKNGRRVYTRVFEFIKKELEGRETPPSQSGGSPNGGFSADAEKSAAKNKAVTGRRVSIDASSSQKNAAESKSGASVPAEKTAPADFDIKEAEKRYSGLSPAAILADAQKAFGADLVIAFSGAEDVVLIDMASKNGLPFSVFCLDTGRLHEETYRFIDEVRNRYSIDIEIFFPDPSLLEPFVTEKGMTSFFEDGHGECCSIRKVEPLKRALAGRRAWATGLRRDQSPATRGDLVHAESDMAHLNPEDSPLVKINPLLDWSSDKVWDYIRAFDVPYNRLHDDGYRSIGCAPCTRASRPGEHERMARWWWENETKRECGLHVK